MISVAFILKFIVAAVGAGTPLLFGTVGEIMSEKVGHLNLGVEGMMAIGAVAGFAAGYATGNLAAAMAAAFLAGMLAALIYAVLTVGFMANQNVIGLTLTIFGVGLSNFIGVYMIGKTDSNTWQLPAELIAQMKNVTIPVLSDIPVLGKLLFNYDPFTYVGIVIALLCGWYLFRTKTGLNVQAIGENPSAADAASIQVTKWKYINILLGGGICGIGGMYMSMVTTSGVWVHGCVSGYGWLAVALVIFATWRPFRGMVVALIFGGLTIMRMYVSIPGLPAQIYDMLPYAATILVLVVTSMRSSREHAQPKSCGLNYFREER